MNNMERVFRAEDNFGGKDGRPDLPAAFVRQDPFVDSAPPVPPMVTPIAEKMDHPYVYNLSLEEVLRQSLADVENDKADVPETLTTGSERTASDYEQR